MQLKIVYFLVVLLALSKEPIMELTDDAKKLIEDHCKSILEQNRATLREGEVEIQKWKDTLREADIYVWAARAFFFIVVLALGGSIYGIFKTQDYLDERIAKNTSNLERLFYAKSLSDLVKLRMRCLKC